MKLLCTFTLMAALAGNSPASADTPAKAPPADKKPPPAGADKRDAKDEVSAADAEKFLAFFNKFVDAIVANTDDCPKMTVAISSLIDANQDVIKKSNEAKAAGKKLPKAVEEKMLAQVKTMMPALKKCAGDKGVQAALKRMNTK